MREVLLFSALLQFVLCEIDPKFNNTPETLRVKQGSRAVLPCSVEYIGGHKVVWASPRKTLISLEDRRLIDDQRISVERPYVKEWNLHIRDVRFNDSGTYKCEINTNPIQFKEVTLSVLVPPSIISKYSSDNIRLRERETAELVCNVTGVPHPNVTWFKRNYLQGRGYKERIGLEGEVLIIHNVTRYCDDIYECYVDNGVPPPVSKAIRVVVEFPPEVMLINKRIGQRQGRETILECNIYGNPQGMTIWKRNGHQIQPADRFTVDAYEDIEKRTVTLSLRINPIMKRDFGSYVCEGSNYLGVDREEMILYEIEPEPTTTTTTTTTTSTSTTEALVYEVYPNVIDDKYRKGNGLYDDFDNTGDGGESYISDTRRPQATLYPGNRPQSYRPSNRPPPYGDAHSDPRSVYHQDGEDSKAATCYSKTVTIMIIYFLGQVIS